MERDELANWLRLTLTPGIGNLTARKLLAAFGLPEAIFSQSPSALQQVVTPAQADALLAEPPELPAQLETTWHWLQNQEGSAPRQILALGDTAYPSALLQIEDPPLLLYAMGRLDLPLHPSQALAMVGSRNPTPQGALNARQFAQSLSQAGLTIVSGMALGVDGAAHEGALAGADDSRLATIAVVGTGLDRVYPKRHHQLAHDIAQHGLIVSEYPLGTPPLAANFPRRNRLIAGLSCSTLVVEAALQSGSLITARLAAEQGKDVFAIPGSIHATQSHGCHALIRQGAKLVESAQDVLEDLPGMPIADRVPTPPPASMATEDSLLQALGFDPVSLDALQARTGLATAPLQARLMTLELDGQVARLPGGLFQRIATT
ncbi:MAG: DNA-protecting protein DprA [Curvibacter sp. PD_MW3]|nr:MAG: DNA-protecting protein DprA [Curvibacter sp. PD_MW3]